MVEQRDIRDYGDLRAKQFTKPSAKNRQGYIKVAACQALEGFQEPSRPGKPVEFENENAGFAGFKKFNMFKIK